MKISASILALIAFVAIFMAVPTEARLRRPCYCRGIGCCGGGWNTGQNPQLLNFDEEDEDVGGAIVSFL